MPQPERLTTHDLGESTQVLMLLSGKKSGGTKIIIG